MFFKWFLFIIYIEKFKNTDDGNYIFKFIGGIIFRKKVNY